MLLLSWGSVSSLTSILEGDGAFRSVCVSPVDIKSWRLYNVGNGVSNCTRLERIDKWLLVNFQITLKFCRWNARDLGLIDVWRYWETHCLTTLKDWIVILLIMWCSECLMRLNLLGTFWSFFRLAWRCVVRVSVLKMVWWVQYFSNSLCSNEVSGRDDKRLIVLLIFLLCSSLLWRTGVDARRNTVKACWAFCIHFRVLSKVTLSPRVAFWLLGAVVVILWGA